MHNTNDQALEAMGDGSEAKEWLGRKQGQDMDQDLLSLSISSMVHSTGSLTSFGRSKRLVFCLWLSPSPSLRNSSIDAVVERRGNHEGSIHPMSISPFSIKASPLSKRHW